MARLNAYCISEDKQLRNVILALLMGVLLVGLMPVAQAMKHSRVFEDGYVATAANGEKIPHPAQAKTYAVQDGATTVQVPEGMAYVAAGNYVMGNGTSAHTVRLSAYAIGKFEVTNAEYKAFCDDAGSSYRPGGPTRTCYWGTTDAQIEAFMARKGNHPVLWVGYNNAIAYCDWVSRKTGRKITLPSEAQWERAARGLTTDGAQNSYPWGNTTVYDDYKTNLTYILNSGPQYGKPQTTVTYGNTTYNLYWPFVADRTSGQVINQMHVAHGTDNTTTTDIDEASAEVKAVWTAILADGGGTTAVGTYKPSPVGVYDLAGNAYEFTRDWYTVSYYLNLANTTIDPVVEDASVLTEQDKQGGSDGDLDGDGVGQATKILRGGSWYAQKASCRTYTRSETRAASTGGFHSVGFRVVALNLSAAAPARVAVASAATFTADSVAREAIAALFGTALSASTVTATSTNLPTTLGNVQVTVQDQAGTVRNAGLFFVSPTQINFQVPAGSAAGSATVNVLSNGTVIGQGALTIAAVAPGLFTANANGRGVPAALLLRVKADGTQSYEPVALFDGTQNAYVATPLDLGGATEQVYLISFGTGIRNRSSLTAVTASIGGSNAAVSYAGAQGSFAGLDQVNLLLPRSLAGRGNVDVVLRVDGQTANTVTISVK